MYGWIGKLLRVDLTTNKLADEPIAPDILTQFMGGKGLGTYYLYKEVPAGADPRGPENRFFLVTGPAQATRVPITGRCAAVSKSPLTNLYIDSNMGGQLGPELKRAGYDMLILQGQAEKPVWLQISPEETAIKDAKQLWGKTTHEVELALRRKDPKISVLSTGPAGEKLVRFACLTHNYFRNFARGGLGAVFGAKRLKAITIRGSPGFSPTPDTDQELALVKELTARARKAKQKKHSLHYHGTPWLVEYANIAGMFPTYNYQTTHFEEYTKLTSDNLEASIENQIRRRPCEGCIISCAWIIKKEFPWIPYESTGDVALPEYETLGMIGGNLGLSDTEVIIQINHLCNILGLDTISTGNIIGLLMELTERELLPVKEQAEGIRFGDGKGALKLIQKIASRNGLGNLLAEGSQDFAQGIGPEAARLAVHVKGLEFPAWDPRGKLGLGLSFATAAAGASHLRGWPVTRDVPEKSARQVVPSLVQQQDLKILKDSLIICHFTHSISPQLTIQDCAQIYQTTTGVQAKEETVRDIASRIWLLARLFNIREYEESPRFYDRLPPRHMEEPIPNGPMKGLTAFVSQQDFEDSLTELYHLRGCDSDGKPTRKAIQKYGLNSLLDN
ncbi:MAG: aldehyde ferredoxin oxidoreductase family protein [Promethearchaeota archaeon]